MSVRIPTDADDAPQFVARVESIAGGLNQLYKSNGLILVKIDNWFDWKWCNFSGKALGAIGIWNQGNLAVPPFVPNRVSWQKRFDEATGRLEDDEHRLHKAVRGGAAEFRKVADIAPGKLLLWFSGNSLKSEHGAVMAYIPTKKGPTKKGPTNERHWVWYAGFIAKNAWQAAEMKGISRAELEAISRHSLQA